MLEGHTPKLCLSNVNVLFIIAQLDRREPGRRSSGEAQRTEISVGDEVSARARGNDSGGVCGAISGDHGASWRIKTSIVRYVAKVAFVANPEAAAQRRLAVAKDIVGKTDARRRGTPSWAPEFADGAIRDRVHLTGLYAARESAIPVVKVGIQVLIIVVLNAIVLVAQAEVDGEPAIELKAVLHIRGPVFVTVAARVGGPMQRRSHGAGRTSQ